MIDEHSALTKYGFEWGPLVVERATSIPNRGYVLIVRTTGSDEYIMITSSPKGKVLKSRHGGRKESKT